jgi:hypothetical protein
MRELMRREILLVILVEKTWLYIGQRGLKRQEYLAGENGREKNGGKKGGREGAGKNGGIGRREKIAGKLC